MNVTEIARQLNVSAKELLEKLPELGIDIGKKAIKVDPAQAERIVQKWAEYQRKLRAQEHLKEREEIMAHQDETAVEEAGEIELPPLVAVRDLASKMQMPVTELIKILMKNGILASQNERIDFETASIMAEDLGFKVKKEQATAEGAGEEDLERIKNIMEAGREHKAVPRSPVIVVMGHVDHGKTRLLDAIRKTNVMEGEAGGITQHIGAYQIERNGRRISFIDTPGHEAFTVMRSRGAKVADIAILVVAVDDGVQPQTKEAVDIIQAAKIPLVVALNKIDKPDANVEKTKKDLSDIGLLPEEWGGKTVMQEISAKQGINIDKLLDMVLLVADLEKDRITANPDGPAIGTIIESHVDKGEGPVATVLVQNGTLRVGDCLGVHGANYGRVRALRDWRGEDMAAVPPGTPVKILGFKAAPAVGDIMEVSINPSELETKKVKANRRIIDEMTGTKRIPIEGEVKAQFNFVIRGDVLGSIEAILGTIEKVDVPGLAIDVIAKGLGNITEGDVLAAEATGAVIYGFNVKALAAVEELAREKKVEIKYFKIIYELFDDIEGRLNAIVKPEIVITKLGRVRVAAIFRHEAKYMIVGGPVIEGAAEANAKVNIWRGEELIGEADITELQSGKQKVNDVMLGQECGLKLAGKTKIEVGDILEIFKEESKTKEIKLSVKN
ncbi:MAG: translation initiation factor IF-2 [Patescibacteria group bacterium]|nr:translation initiation factor IF-2 [Patescibacteria group bacterium]